MPSKLQEDSQILTPQRLSDKVARAIQEDLIASRRQPGDQLPTEPVLAARYGVSRTVVREASRLLVERGLVTIRPGSGMVVAEFDGTTISRQYKLMLAMQQPRFEELMEMRLVLEVGLTEYAAQRRTEADLIEIEETLHAFSDKNLSLDSALEWDLKFHMAVAQASHNPFFVSLVNPINDYLRNTYIPSLGYAPAMPRTLHEHGQIAQAIQLGDSKLAGEMARNHLMRILTESNQLTAEEI